MVKIEIPDAYEFEYTTISRIRSEGLASGSLSDSDARLLIRQMSKMINKFTGQWFWPIESVERLNGNGFPIITHNTYIPILEVRGINVESASNQSVLDISSYVVNNRYIDLKARILSNVADHLYNTGYVNFGKHRPHNVIVDGTFGWLENKPYVSDSYNNTAKKETTTTGSLARDATSITVVDASSLRVRDVVIFRNGGAGSSYAGHAILTAINTGSNTLTFDPVNLNVSSLSSGSTVITYGQVPELVERACLILVIYFKDKLSSASSSSSAVASRLISERTDNYQYTLKPDDSTSSSFTTGSTEADRLLREYHAPPILMGV